MTDQAFAYIVMALSLLAIVAAYAIVCRKDKSLFNFLTPALILFVPANYILQGLFLYFFSPGGSRVAYLVCYTSYSVMFLGTALAYAFLSPPDLGWKESKGAKRVRWSPWLILAFAFLAWMPVLLEFRDFWSTPREIYKLTRTGYGLNFFGSALLTNIAFVVFLFKHQASRMEKALFVGASLAISFLRGSKAHVFTLLALWILHEIYVRGRRFGVGKALTFACILAAALVGMFSVFGTFEDAQDLAIGIVQYSDYTRNAMLVVDEPVDHGIPGILTFENQVYSRIPRVFFPSKPKDFGIFYLAERYYPEWFEADTGSPDFGIGVQFADFGYFAPVYLFLWGVLQGIGARCFVERLRKHPNCPNFVLLVFFASVVLIPIGSTYLLPEHFAIAIVLAFMFKLRFGISLRPRRAALNPRVLPA